MRKEDGGMRWVGRDGGIVGGLGGYWTEWMRKGEEGGC